MPRYDYVCPKCNNREEYVHSMKKRPKFLCSECNVAMEKQIGIGIATNVKKHKFFGDWYEKNFHKDIAEGTADKMKLTKERLDKHRSNAHKIHNHKEKEIKSHGI